MEFLSAISPPVAGKPTSATTSFIIQESMLGSSCNRVTFALLLTLLPRTCTCTCTNSRTSRYLTSFVPSTIINSPLKQTTKATGTCAVTSRTMVAEQSLPTPTTERYTPVHVYPYEADISDIRAQGSFTSIKRIHIVRHAEGTHNVNHQYKDIQNLDARLTERGKEQCEFLSKKLSVAPSSNQNDMLPYNRLLQHTDLVVTSPLTRCMETAMYSFPSLTTTYNQNGHNSNDNKKKFVAHESVRETVNYACDRRRAISDMEDCFHETVCFREIQHDHDEIWNSYERRLGEWDSHRESAELHVVADRARDFFQWLQNRPEQEIVVCTHSAFLRCLVSWGQPGGVQWIMEQHLDKRGVCNISQEGEEVPVLKYCGDKAFQDYMRRDYENCELRSFVAAFPANPN